MNPIRTTTLVNVLAATVITVGLATAPSGAVEVVPTSGTVALAYKPEELHRAAVSPAVKRKMAWNVEVAAVNGDMATSVQGNSVADPTQSDVDAVVSPPGSIDPSTFLPADRATTWNPGMMAVGGIPVRSTICATLTPRGGALDDTAQIQAAINACPAGQVVQLAAGTFIINSGNFLLINKGITLRGAGPGQTTLAKTNGAKPFPSGRQRQALAADHRRPGPYSVLRDTAGVVGSTDLTADAVKGAYTVTVASAAGFSPGQIVLLDEASGAGWRTDPLGRGQIWASSDWRVVWQKHNPALQHVDDFAADAFPTTPGSRWVLVLATGPTHRRDQANRLRLRVNHHASPRPSTSPTGPATQPSFRTTGDLTSGTPGSRT